MGGVAPGKWHNTSQDATYEVVSELFLQKRTHETYFLFLPELRYSKEHMGSTPLLDKE